jgi:hypothetical protein
VNNWYRTWVHIYSNDGLVAKPGDYVWIKDRELATLEDVLQHALKADAQGRPRTVTFSLNTGSLVDQSRLSHVSALEMVDRARNYHPGAEARTLAHALGMENEQFWRCLRLMVDAIDA